MPVSIMDKRKSGERAGRRAEGFAAGMMRLKGYRVRARRYRCPVGEIDLVLSRGNLRVFMEVKYRSNLAAAAEAVSLHQRTRINKAAQYWLMQYEAGGDERACRFDVFCVAPWGLLRHIKNAWIM